MKISKILLFSIVIVGLASSCEKAYVLPEPVTDDGGGGGGGGGGTPATVFFSTDIYPLFNANGCMDCHGSQAPTFNSIANAYSQLVPGFVVAGSASTSDLYNTLTPTGNMTVNQGYTVSAAELVKIETWINEGAKNN